MIEKCDSVAIETFKALKKHRLYYDSTTIATYFNPIEPNFTLQEIARKTGKKKKVELISDQNKFHFNAGVVNFSNGSSRWSCNYRISRPSIYSEIHFVDIALCEGPGNENIWFRIYYISCCYLMVNHYLENPKDRNSPIFVGKKLFKILN
jgi:hypothetical protein